MKWTIVSAVAPSLVLGAFVAAAIAVTGASFARPVVVTAVMGFAAAAFLVGLAFSMGLRHERVALRLVILLPLALAVALVVVVMLETHHRAAVVGP